MVGRITPAGVITVFHDGIPVGSVPQDIVAGSDGNLYFTMALQKAIGKITPPGWSP